MYFIRYGYAIIINAQSQEEFKNKILCNTMVGVQDCRSYILYNIMIININIYIELLKDIAHFSLQRSTLVQYNN